jgi:hypothetical protein
MRIEGALPADQNQRSIWLSEHIDCMEGRFGSLTTRGWRANYEFFSRALIDKADRAGFDSESLAKVIRCILADASGQPLAYVPVAAYETTLNGEPVWVVAIHWEEYFGPESHSVIRLHSKGPEAGGVHNLPIAAKMVRQQRSPLSSCALPIWQPARPAKGLAGVSHCGSCVYAESVASEGQGRQRGGGIERKCHVVRRAARQGESIGGCSMEPLFFDGILAGSCPQDPKSISCSQVAPKQRVARSSRDWVHWQRHGQAGHA